MEGDEVLQQQGRQRAQSARCSAATFSTSRCWESPPTRTPWILQFGGHHLALNITMVGERGVLTPTLTGAQPAIYKLGDKTVRPLKGESDKAIGLLKSLNANQRKPGNSRLPRSQSRAGPGRRWQDDPARRTQGHGDEREPARNAARPDFRVDRHHRSQTPRPRAWRDEVRHRPDSGLPGARRQTSEAGSNVTASYRIQGPHLVIEVRASRAATRRCTSTRCIAIRPTTTARGSFRSDAQNRCVRHRRFRIIGDSAPAFAHEVDEYVQAALISLERDHLDVQVRLVPGAEVFSQVFARHRHERRRRGVGCREAGLRAQRVLRDLTLSLNGQRVSAHIVSAQFPSVDLMKEGLGEIQLGLRVSARRSRTCGEKVRSGEPPSARHLGIPRELPETERCRTTHRVPAS